MGHEAANQARQLRAPTPPAEPELPIPRRLSRQLRPPRSLTAIDTLTCTSLRLCLSAICPSPTKQEALQPLAGFYADHALCARFIVLHTRFQPFRTWPMPPPLPLPAALVLLTLAADFLSTWPLRAGPALRAGSQRSAHPGLPLRGPGHGGHAFDFPTSARSRPRHQAHGTVPR